LKIAPLQVETDKVQAKIPEQPVTPEASSKRSATNSNEPVAKRPITNSIYPLHVFLDAWERRLDGSLARELNGATIFVDSGPDEPEIKDNAEDDEIEDDIYNATP
jgi:hypothetical protein